MVDFQRQLLAIKMLGFTKSNLQRGFLLNKNSDGDTPVVDGSVM